MTDPMPQWLADGALAEQHAGTALGYAAAGYVAGRDTPRPAPRIVLRTNHDDWRELSTSGLDGIAHTGHRIPEHVWIGLLRAAGVTVEIQDLPEDGDGDGDELPEVPDDAIGTSPQAERYRDAHGLDPGQVC